MTRRNLSRRLAADPPQLQRRARRRRHRRRHRAVQHRARAGRRAQSRRAAAALRHAGRHRPGLPARRRDRQPACSRSSACPNLQIMNADTETNVDVARSRAEKLIGDGAQLLIGAFDSGQSTRDRAGRRAEGHPLRHQHRRRPADHRAGLQVRVPQFPDRGR